MTTKIGYNITATTAKQELIIQNASISISAYYKSQFHNIISVSFKLIALDNIVPFDISHHCKVIGSQVSHTILYEFHNEKGFPKKEMKEFINTELDKYFESKGFHE